ncbi:hypothetical protein [Plantactinospora sp. KLBMP9567]|nr:hypothetical protein [Plantactinospora sp. KLBMP9567]MDW5327633.1 hypothetical protein [Plantactinospora sp. KLBMP9567]
MRITGALSVVGATGRVVVTGNQVTQPGHADPLDPAGALPRA